MKAVRPLLITALFVLCSCAGSYKDTTFGDRYTENQLASDVYEITFQGDSTFEADKERDFVLLRAADLAHQNGYTYFSVLNSSNEPKPIPVQWIKQMPPDPAVKITQGESTGNNTAQKPFIKIVITCFKQKPATPYFYEVSETQKSLRKKYKLE